MTVLYTLMGACLVLMVPGDVLKTMSNASFATVRAAPARRAPRVVLVLVVGLLAVAPVCRPARLAGCPAPSLGA